MRNESRVKVAKLESSSEVGVAPRAKTSGTTSDKNDDSEGLITVA